MSMQRARLVPLRGVATVAAIVFLGTLALGVGVSTVAKTVVLEVQDWRGNDVGKIREWLDLNKASFEANNPDIEVQYTFGNFGPEAILVRVASGAPADVAFASIAFARDLFEAGAIRDLTPYIQKNPEVIESLIPVHLPYSSVKGAQFGIPATLTASAIVYNTRHFDEAGLDTDPLAMRTWADFQAFCAKLTKRDSEGQIRRAAFQQGFGIEIFASWLHSNGTSFFDPDFTRAGFSGQRGIETLTFLRDLREHAGQVAGFRTDFYAESASMLYYETYGLGNPLMHKIEQPGFTSIPLGPSGTKRGSVAWSNMYTIPINSRKPDLAWAFIAHVASRECSIGMLEIMEGIPFSPRRDVYQSEIWRKFKAARPVLASLLDIIQVAGPWPFHRRTQINQEAIPVLTRAWNSQLAPEVAIEEAARIVDHILRKG